jgi:hypothetical protein
MECRYGRVIIILFMNIVTWSDISRNVYMTKIGMFSDVPCVRIEKDTIIILFTWQLRLHFMFFYH